MRKFRTILVSGLLALPPSVADAGTAMARQNVPIPVVNYAPGAAVSVAAGGVNSLNLGSGLGGSSTINVQTNIDNSKTIDASSNIDVNTTINGSDIAYGLNGANVLNVIDNRSEEHTSELQSP